MDVHVSRVTCTYTSTIRVLASRRVGSARAFVVGLLAILAVASCAPPHMAEAPEPPADPTRLSHDHHAQIACVRCHVNDSRPGHDHQPCDDGKCHKAAFLAPPGAVCVVCHTAVTTSPLDAPLRPYPTDDAWQAEPSKFSHKLHTDGKAIEGAVGFHVTCADCHVRGDALARPNHATCARCHAPEAGLAHAPRMDDCAGCHEPGNHQRVRARLIRDDLSFAHDRHRADRRGQPIRCEQCHAQSAQATGFADHVAPRVQSCVGCHDDSDRTPETMRMRICEACHSERRSTLTKIAPRSHLPATERPLDHTLAFRRDHQDAAERDGGRCAACHTQMSGNPRDMCDECHQTMRPADHRITWRELEHGEEAATDTQRCARCHVVEFCTACHSQRPRSHGYAGTFVSDHGPLARVNVRSCLTCHDEQRDCATCHSSTARPRR